MESVAQSSFYSIPKQELNLYKMIADTGKKWLQTIKAFEISKQVTLKEYKEYLAEIKKDSSETFYHSQLPDSSIGSRTIREKYLNDKQYEEFPVLGISWENAMNYCKWKTLKENSDTIRFVYRLPHCSEWLAAFNYLENNKHKHDLNINYSDWTINSFDESVYDFMKGQHKEQFFFDWMYFHSPKESRVLKRKRVIGNNYLYQQDKHFMDNSCFYAFEGYKYVGFRCVKETLSPIKDEEKEIIKYTSVIVLKHWGIKKK